MADSSSPAAPPAATPTTGGDVRTWRTGTLVYTGSGLAVLFCWLLAGDFSWSIKERSVIWVVQLMLKKFEASDTIVGTLIGGLPHAMTFLLTPIVSYMSDRHRGRWGRRIPYLAVTTPFASLAILGLAFSPEIGIRLHAMLGTGSPGLNDSTLIVFGVFWTVFEVASVIANTVFFALINDVVPQAVLGRFYGLFRSLGLAVAVAFNFWLFGKVETHYAWIFISVGGLYTLGFAALCLKVREGVYPPPPPATPTGPTAVFAAIRTYARECFTNPYYIWVYATVALSWMALMSISLFNLLYAKQVDLDFDAYGKCLALTYVISFTLSYFVGVLVDRFHPLRLALITMALYGAGTCAGGLLITDRQSFAIMLVICGVLAGLWQTAAASLTMRLLPQAKYAQYESARALVTSLGMMLVGPVLGWVMDLTSHAYRFTYLTAAGLSVLAVASGLVTYAHFRRLGGLAHYVAPE